VRVRDCGQGTVGVKESQRNPSLGHFIYFYALVSHMLCFDVLWHHALSLAFLFSKAGVPSLPRFCGYGTEKVSNILQGSNNLVAM